MDDPAAGPIPGICGTYAVGATLWHRAERWSEVVNVRVERWAVLAGGRPEQLPVVDLEPPYRTTTTASEDPGHLVKELHTRMRRAEGETASALAADAFVIADGPLNELEAKPVVGYIKSHRVTYLPPEQNAVIAELAPGQRTPLFTIARVRRYSWYVRLAMLQGGHSWTGIVRCEASGQLPKEEVRVMADRTAAVLPVVASEAHIDPRAPQNLVPSRRSSGNSATGWATRASSIGPCGTPSASRKPHEPSVPRTLGEVALEVLDRHVRAREHESDVSVRRPLDQVGRASIRAVDLQDLAVPLALAHVVPANHDPISNARLHLSTPP